ncbi:Hypothetical protein SRAE_2000331300 [Strongyloides ratti]|uniref:Uncharacterized protein n=1 Tax=Strongyloides ratti TaxID=34506 RepID=A0A090LKI1_STRRB|nr:Hypothetical protein SRAE_2000331300 [Strongyloides ratti]CEF68658.1 Hypothetical protein SRAE_2000331300 [Strongyloides ratti]
MTDQHRLIYWFGGGLMMGPNFSEVTQESCQNNITSNRPPYKRNAALRMNWLYTIEKKPVYLNTGVASLAKLIFTYPKEFLEYCNTNCFSTKEKNGLLLACNKYLKFDSRTNHFSPENYRRQKSGAKFFQWRIGNSKIHRCSSITFCNTSIKSAPDKSNKKEKPIYANNIQNLLNVSKNKCNTTSAHIDDSKKKSVKFSSKSVTTENKEDALDSYSKWLIEMNKKASIKKNCKNKTDEKSHPVYDDLDDLINNVDAFDLKEDKSNKTEEGSNPTNKNLTVEKDYNKVKK